MGVTSAREHADLIIEEAKRIQDDKETDAYEVAYQQGRKDASRVILLALADEELR